MYVALVSAIFRLNAPDLGEWRALPELAAEGGQAQVHAARSHHAGSRARILGVVLGVCAAAVRNHPLQRPAPPGAAASMSTLSKLGTASFGQGPPL